MNGTGPIGASVISHAATWMSDAAASDAGSAPAADPNAMTRVSPGESRGESRATRIARHLLDSAHALPQPNRAIPHADNTHDVLDRLDTPPYRAIPGDAEMGIVADYLPQDDKLRLRALNAALKTAVDRTIHSLTLNAKEVIALFDDTQSLPHLKQLHLIDWNDQDLIDLANRLRNKVHTPFELMLTGRPQQSAPDLRCLVTLNLSGLTLSDLRITPETSHALSAAAFPMAIVAPPTGLMTLDDIEAITQIPTLRVLCVGFSALSDAIASALRTLPALTDFACCRINSQQLRDMLANPQIRSVQVEAIAHATHADFTALATHPALTSLHLGTVDHARDLSTLSRNATITALHLGLKAPAIASLPHLAAMPALRELTLSGIFHEDRIAELTPPAILAICRMPLRHLAFHFLTMRGSNIAVALSAHARALHVRVRPGTTDLVVDDQAIDALIHNPHVSSLSLIGGHIVDGGAARIAACPGLESLTLELTSSGETLASVQRAWTAAGKPLVDLNATISPPPDGIAAIAMIAEHAQNT